MKVERDGYLFKACKIKSVSFVLYDSKLFACFFEITLLYSKALKHLHKTAYDPDKTSIKSPMITVLSFPGALSDSVTNCAGIFKQSMPMGTTNRIGIGLSYRPARLHRLAKLIP